MLDPSRSFSDPSPGRSRQTKWLRQPASFIPFSIEDVETSIPARFERIAALHRDRLAVKTHSGAALTYGELNVAANRIASAIVGKRATPSEPVALLFEQSTLLIPAIMAVLKSGKCFVALDPAFPRDRNHQICIDAGTRMILTDRDNAAMAHSLAGQLDHVMVIDDLDEQSAADNLDIKIGPRAVAALIYTSGSTGVPKAVVQNHRSLLHAAMRRVNSFQISAEDRLTLVSAGFMQALMNIFSALLSGACVCAFPAKKESTRALVRWLQEEEITIYHSSASLFREVLDALTGDEDLSKIRLIRSASEAVTAREIHAYRKHFSSDCIYVTGLSTTETSTVTFNFMDKATPIDTERVPIGYPLQDIEVLLLDDQRQSVQAGCVGEIAIRCEYISPGYWRNEDLTAAKFLADPDGGDRKIFLTGDSGRQLDDGRFEHVGRMDFRVKIRGHAVDTSEIEAKLLTHPHIKEVAVIGSEAQFGESSLTGYFVPTRTPGPSIRDLRNFLGNTLPDFMIPSAFVTLDILPRTLNGKIDRLTLPRFDALQDTRARAIVSPRTPVERELEKMWREVLRVDAISVDDDFYDVGGHSLAATRIANRVAETFHQELPLQALFQSPTIEGMAALIANHAAMEAPPDEQKQQAVLSITNGSRDCSAPLSYAQLRLWFLDQLHPGQSTYNLFVAYRIEGDLDVRLVEQAFNEIIRRHEILRTVFTTAVGEPSQMVLPPSALTIPLHDLRAIAGNQERWTAARRIFEREARQPFDLGKGPLLRIALIRLRDEEYALTRAVHHIISDGWSDGILLDELCEIYEALATGRSIALGDLPTQYADFSLWQRQAPDETSLQQLSYWRRQLDNAAPLNLPTDRFRHALRTRRGARQYFALSGDLSSALKKLSRKCGVTLFTTLLAAYQTLLHRYSNQTDIVIGCPVAGRNRTELEGLIGFFLNMLVLRLDLSGNPTFMEALSRARDVCLGALSHQEVRFEKIVEALHPARQADQNPFFEVTFAFRNTPAVTPRLQGFNVEALQVQTGIARFDLHLFLEEVGEHLEGYFDYDTTLFHAETIQRAVGHLENLLKAAVRDPRQRVSDLALLSETEREQLLVEWNDTDRDYPGEKCVHEVFEARAATSPKRTALVFGDQEVTYGELNTRANQLAHYVHRIGVRRGGLVAVCMERSVGMVVALLSILKAGGAYVPLDPAYPQQRLRFMLQDAQIGIILTDSASFTRLPATDARRICLDREWQHISTTESSDALPNGTTSDDLAYVIYTSGSSGRPKGVEVRHRGIVRLLFGADYVQLDSARTLIHMAPISFDAATFELWGALLHGARCVLFPGLVPSARELGALLQRHSIDTLWLTTALFNAVIDDDPHALSGIKQLLFGGEAGSLPHVRKAVALLPQTQLTNFYGPTENTTFTTCYPIPSRLDDTLTSVPIGRPIANTRIYILDPHLKPVPIGVPGELYIGGDGLARGYLNRDDVTAERFVADPFGAAGSKLYKSGDLARYLPDGNIEFLGRLDDQVKIRGFRIEPGEVEAALKQCSGVHEGAVTTRTDDTGHKALVAYVVASRGAGLDAQRLRTELRSTLPDYMVPSAFVFVPFIPLTPSGKVDRQGLPVHAISLPGESAYVAPRTAVEHVLVEIWADILRIDRISVHDNFFDLGGHSLMGTRLIARICSEFGIDVPLRRLFEYPTISGLAESLEGALISRAEDRSAGSPWRYLVELKVYPGGPNVFFLPGGFGSDSEFLVYARLVHFVEGHFSFYGLRARSAEGTQSAHANVEEMTADYLREIRTLQPEGPYLIVGNCIGGIVAYEIAQQLTALGQSVALLAMMDTWRPTRQRYSSYRLKQRITHAFERSLLNYQITRLPFHWEQVRNMTWRERAAYALKKASMAVSDLSLHLKDAAPDSAHKDRAADELERRNAQEGYVDALRRYRPRPYSGRVAILVNEKAYERDPVTGWAGLIQGGVSIRKIPGDHTAYIRLHVRTAARALNECLEATCAADA